MDTIEFAATFEGQGDTLSGVVHVFGTRTYKYGRAMEFEPGAFDRSIAAGEITAFYSHDQSKPLAKPSLEVRNGALHFSMELGHQSYAEDLRENRRMGLMNKMSFGIRKDGAKFTDVRERGETVRRFRDVAVYDISPVVIPAFEGTLIHSGSPDDRAREAARARARVLGGTRNG